MLYVKGKLEQASFIGLLMDVLPELLWVKDVNGNYIACNEQFTKTFAVKASEIIGKTDNDFFSKEQAERFSASDHCILEAQQDCVSEEIVFPLTTGNELILESKKIQIISKENGALLGVLGIANNITAKKKSEQDLKHKENLFHTVFNSQFQFTGVLSNEGEVVEVNDLPLKVQGVKRGDYIGKKFWESPAWRNLPEWKNIWQQRLQQASEQNSPVLTEDVFQVQDGSIHYAQASTAAMRDEHGNLTGFIVQAMDITEIKNSEQAAKKSEKKYRTLYEQIPQGVMLHDATGKIIGANPAAETILGRPLSFLLAHFSHPKDWQGIREDGSDYGPDEHPVMKALYEGEAIKNAVIGGLNLETQTHTWILLDAIPMYNRDETKPYGVFTSFSDITERKLTEEKLRLSASVFDNTQEAIMVTDEKGSIVEVNPAFTEITGYAREEVLGYNPKMLRSEKHDHNFYQTMKASLKENGTWSGETLNRRKDGTIYPVWQNVSAVTDSHGMSTQHVAIFTDISQLKQSQQKLDHLAYHDPLTDLPNRMLLKERLDQAILHAARHNDHFAVIFLDLDNFKNINDSLGHSQGDLLLQNIASYLLKAVRQGDTVARIGGDEFVLLLEELSDVDKVEGIAQKILQALQQPIALESRSLNVSASLGICLYPQDGKTTDELLRNADAAMYRAKDEGRNNYQFYSKELTRNAFMRIRLENDFRLALNHKEFTLHFQPQIDLQNNQLIGVEALIRWQHPKLGMIMPDNFITIAENSGLIIPMGNWVLEAACSQAMKWFANGIDIGRVAVNVSALQLQRGGLVEQVKKVLLKTGLPASKLELEVTEAVIMKHLDSSISQLNELRDFGVSLAIDDFGTGYSSLSYLKQLPIQKLKIDRSFIRDIAIDADDRAISRTIVALGDSLGMIVIAEGVENNAQANYLRDEGCHEVQGYLYSKPISTKNFEAYYHLTEH